MINIQKGKNWEYTVRLFLSLSLKKVRTSAWTESFRNFRLFVILSQLLLFFVLRRIFCLCPSVVLSRYPVRVSLFCNHVDICGVFVREKCVFYFCLRSASMQLELTLPHPLQHIHPLRVVTLHVFLLFKDFTGWTNFLLGNQDKLG